MLVFFKNGEIHEHDKAEPDERDLDQGLPENRTTTIYPSGVLDSVRRIGIYSPNSLL